MRYSSGILPTDFGFTHQRADATSGLDDYGARWYDPVAGQFTSADTTLAGELNRYAYVAGNPETRTDPSGHVYAQRTTPYYQDFGAAVYNLIAKDEGHAGNGMSTALFIARYDADAYRSAEAFGARHGVLMMPHVGEDANTYVGAMTKAHAGYWNSSSAAMLEYVQLRALSHDAVVANTGVRSGDLNLFNADWQPMLRATGRPGPLSGDGSGEGGSSGGASGGGAGCGESFTPATLVATPHGEQAIATLTVGQQVTAYDPTTGKQTTQTIERVFINHDTDRLDVTLAYQTPAAAAGVTTGARAGATGHGRAARTDQRHPAATTTTAENATRAEVIHTTASHPWLTADAGWQRAGQLHSGEAVRLLDGATATVVTLQVVPGVGPMWDLSLDATHTFAVGTLQAVVHNCTPVVGDPSTIADNLDENTYVHYTNKEGYEGIMKSDDEAVLAQNAKGKVYAAQEIYTPAEAEQNLFIGDSRYAGKGDYVIVFQAPEGANFSPGEQANEFINRGTVRVPTSNILYAGPNPW